MKEKSNICHIHLPIYQNHADAGIIGALYLQGSESMESMNHGLKIFKKQKSRKFQKAELEFTALWQLFTWYLHYIYNYLHSIYIVLGIISNQGIKYIVGYMQMLDFLYKRLEHQQILVSGLGPGTCPPWLWREDCIMIKIQIHLKTGLNSEFLLLLCVFQVIDSETPTIS